MSKEPPADGSVTAVQVSRCRLVSKATPADMRGGRSHASPDVMVDSVDSGSEASWHVRQTSNGHVESVRRTCPFDASRTSATRKTVVINVSKLHVQASSARAGDDTSHVTRR